MFSLMFLTLLVVVRDEYGCCAGNLLLGHNPYRVLCVYLGKVFRSRAHIFCSDTNTFFSKFLPMSAYLSFDNTGLAYNATAIITDGTFDVEKYRAYSPLYMSATLAVAYGVSFASFTAVLVHTFCAL